MSSNPVAAGHLKFPSPDDKLLYYAQSESMAAIVTVLGDLRSAIAG
jgi:hypothetical protein